MSRSNINISSNVFTVISEQPWQEAEFISKVLDFKALEIVNNNPVYRERLSNLQRDLLEHGLYCSRHPKKYRTWGMIKDDKKPICRCELVNTCEDAERGKCK